MPVWVEDWVTLESVSEGAEKLEEDGATELAALDLADAGGAGAVAVAAEGFEELEVLAAAGVDVACESSVISASSVSSARAAKACSRWAFRID